MVMLIVVACGDDDGGGDATPTDAVSISTPAASFRAVEADYYAVLADDIVGLFRRVLDQDEVAQPVPDCTYDEPNTIIDCTVSGVGTIALATAPTGGVTECRGLIKPSTDLLFAASCNTEDGAAWVYVILE